MQGDAFQRWLVVGLGGVAAIRLGAEVGGDDAWARLGHRNRDSTLRVKASCTVTHGHGGNDGFPKQKKIVHNVATRSVETTTKSSTFPATCTTSLPC